MADFFEVNEEVQDDFEIVEQCLLNVAELVRDEVLNLTDSRDTADVLTSLIMYRLPQVLDVLYDEKTRGSEDNLSDNL